MASVKGDEGLRVNTNTPCPENHSLYGMLYVTLTNLDIFSYFLA